MIINFNKFLEILKKNRHDYVTFIINYKNFLNFLKNIFIVKILYVKRLVYF